MISDFSKRLTNPDDDDRELVARLWAKLSYANRKYDNAVKYMKEALGIKPRNPYSLTLLGDCYKAKGDVTTGNGYYGQALEWEPILPNRDSIRQKMSK